MARVVSLLSGKSAQLRHFSTGILGNHQSALLLAHCSHVVIRRGILMASTCESTLLLCEHPPPAPLAMKAPGLWKLGHPPRGGVAQGDKRSALGQGGLLCPSRRPLGLSLGLLPGRRRPAGPRIDLRREDCITWPPRLMSHPATFRPIGLQDPRPD